MTTLVFIEMSQFPNQLLPDEILVTILILVPERFHQGPELWSTACRRLARICRDWRRIIRGTLCFRSAFCFQPGTPLSDIRAFDNMTSDVPVSLAFHFLEEDTEHSDAFHQWLEACVDALSGCLARCRFVHIKVEKCGFISIALESTAFRRGDADHRGAHYDGRYQSLDDPTRIFLVDLVDSGAPLQHFQCLSPRILPSPSTIPHASTHLPRLGDFYDYDEDTSDPPRMRHLTHLRLVVHSSRAFQPVSQLVMPVLANLYYEATSDEAVLQLVKRFEQIGQNVERLAIRSGIPAADTFLEIDRLLPSTGGCRKWVDQQYIQYTPPGFAVTIPLRDVWEPMHCIFTHTLLEIKNDGYVDYQDELEEVKIAQKNKVDGLARRNHHPNNGCLDYQLEDDSKKSALIKKSKFTALPDETIARIFLLTLRPVLSQEDVYQNELLRERLQDICLKFKRVVDGLPIFWSFIMLETANDKRPSPLNSSELSANVRKHISNSAPSPLHIAFDLVVVPHGRDESTSIWNILLLPTVKRWRSLFFRGAVRAPQRAAVWRTY
ncbi:hypothetical protein R3P38DRAFT_2815099 [Favolaschia claudopus]|uniref:F-box domain-containing protein n=1 Tax=Favolaschia claudopus TaxID=2862362 RepID=A0AAV9Z1U5_9AGAR